MRVPLSWLRDYVEWDLPLPELIERLTTAGLEVAGVEYVGRRPRGELPKLGRREREGAEPELDWENVHVGELLEVKPHPNADKLVIAVVDYGQGPVESVTGAPNVRVGDKGYKVAVATPGAVLIDPYAEGHKLVEVKPAKLRGVHSEVVLCSERELGISDDHTGILILDRDAPVGRPLAELLSDVVLEFDLTPNLARCFSIIGVAREVAALTGQRFKTPEVEWHPGPSKIEGQVEVEIADPELCARYCAALVRGVRVRSSPFWMRWRLLLSGLRPINNIVDVTNYVMWEWGQPLHAFDYNRVHGRDGGPPAVIVRRAKPGERIVTLDEVERELSPEMLLITDPGGPIAIAGVMGGLESEVTEATRDVLLESANFNRVSIRRTSQALKLASEAAARFGRGLPPELTVPALMRAAELIRELAGGEIADGIVDVYPRPQEETVIDFDPKEVERLLGLALSAEEIMEVLERLEFECHPRGEGKPIQVKVPPHRLDVTIPADLVEEVARVVGYEKIPATLMADPLPPLARDRERELEERARDLLVSAGLTEVITYSLTSLEAVAKLDPERKTPPEAEYLKLANPLTREREYLRRSLLPELLSTVGENLKHRERVAIFEIGRVYLPTGEGRPREPRRLALALAGPRCELSWHGRPEPFDFFDLKGIIEELLRRLGVDDLHVGNPKDNDESPSWLHPGRAAVVIVAQEGVGYFGEVHPQVRENFELPVRVIAGELDLEAILKRAGQLEAEAKARARAYRPLPRFPAVWRDLAIVVDEEVPAERVAQLIEEASGELLHKLVLFDVYRGKPIPQGKKSLTWRLWLLSPERTLTDEEADALRERIERRLAEELGAELRK